MSVAFRADPAISMVGFALTTLGLIATLPVFWGVPTAFLGGTAAAAGIALINSFGNLSGFVAPYLIGLIKDATNSTDLGLHMLAGLLVLGALFVLAVKVGAACGCEVIAGHTQDDLTTPDRRATFTQPGWPVASAAPDLTPSIS